MFRVGGNKQELQKKNNNHGDNALFFRSITILSVQSRKVGAPLYLLARGTHATAWHNTLVVNSIHVRKATPVLFYNQLTAVSNVTSLTCVGCAVLS